MPIHLHLEPHSNEMCDGCLPHLHIEKRSLMQGEARRLPHFTISFTHTEGQSSREWINGTNCMAPKAYGRVSWEAHDRELSLKGSDCTQVLPARASSSPSCYKYRPKIHCLHSAPTLKKHTSMTLACVHPVTTKERKARNSRRISPIPFLNTTQHSIRPHTFGSQCCAHVQDACTCR